MNANQDEIARFSAQAEQWWDHDGPFAPLHRLNPVRLRYIRANAVETPKKSFDGLRVLDVGCGGGLLSEPMARLGAHVVALDASEATINVARHHAQTQELEIDYRVGTIDQIHDESFDLILNMEVVEHVDDVENFISSCAACLKPDGMMILSTINRTPEAFLFAIIGGEYILRWLPIGTHDYQKFVTPDELQRALKNNDLRLAHQTGVFYNPLMQRFDLSKNMRVNYMMCAVKRRARRSSPPHESPAPESPH